MDRWTRLWVFARRRDPWKPRSSAKPRRKTNRSCGKCCITLCSFRKAKNRSTVRFCKDPAVSKYIEGWGRTGDIGYIALIRDVPVGSATARFFSRKNPGYGFIDESIPELGMAVLPEYRGRGIGTLLLRTLMQSLSDRGIGAVSLSVDVRNPAERLYEWFGFYEVGTTGRSMTMRADLTDEGANHE